MKALLTLSESYLRSLGVIDWGYTEESIPHSFQKLLDWISSGDEGPLSYLSDHRKDLRQDLRLVYPEFQSALVFYFSYQATKKWMIENNRHEIAAYAMGFGGEDYHSFLKDKLNLIHEKLRETHPEVERFIALDAQPVMERDLAYRAGLGWFGKNSMLISRKEGSYFIIGSLLLNQKLAVETEDLDTDHCGQCNACIEACPTVAIDPVNRTITAEKCLSTYTIETFREAPAPEGFNNSRGEVFGCDICQDVCPWNRKPLSRVMSSLDLKEKFGFLKTWFYEMTKLELMKMMESDSNRGLKRKLQGAPFDRPGKEGWIKNLKAYLSRPNRNDP